MSLNDWSASEVAKAVGGSGRSAPRKTSKGYSVCCPAHADRTPSLSLTDGSDGMLLYYCFGGCSQAEVKAALESTLGIDSSAPASTSEKPKKKKVVVPIEDPIEALMPVPANAVRGTADDFWHHALGLPSKVWTYKLANGETAGFIARYETDAGKEVIPWSWTRDNKTGEEKLRQKAMPSPRPLYNLEEIVARPNDPIIWNEGEKAADAAKKLFPGWVSTANPGVALPLNLRHDAFGDIFCP
ncbi:CHC2 zinc finger domain-containing protein [Croceicoccus gelatinilyticus]|uniref:CHC2 zinc finger domain-containing protein n=1 Tax=Croceicoccus gelatinilyticus TaxID=2835536 RepID=UPI001BCD4152|nr:CHC2 zinc finger domain-containing protein [Croceicoccus gelatinilyticus]MBS7671559.1 hypothetical protein [Croceicoccus gelatinilyticus]